MLIKFSCADQYFVGFMCHKRNSDNLILAMNFNWVFVLHKIYSEKLNDKNGFKIKKKKLFVNRKTYANQIIKIGITK